MDQEWWPSKCSFIRNLSKKHMDCTEQQQLLSLFTVWSFVAFLQSGLGGNAWVLPLALQCLYCSQIWVCPCLNFKKRKHLFFLLRNLKLLFWEEVEEFHTSYLWISRISVGIGKHVHTVHRASGGDWVYVRFWFQEALVSVYQPGFQLSECPGLPVLLVRAVPLLWCKALELQHDWRM